MASGTGSDTKISKPQIRKAVKHGVFIWNRGFTKSIADGFISYFKSVAWFGNWCFEILAAQGVQTGGFLIPQDKIAHLTPYKHLLSAK